jgi:hypothetical protein
MSETMSDDGQRIAERIEAIAYEPPAGKGGEWAQAWATLQVARAVRDVGSAVVAKLDEIRRGVEWIANGGPVDE